MATHMLLAEDVLNMPSPRAADVANARLTKRARAWIDVGRRMERATYAPQESASDAEAVARWARHKGLPALQHEELWIVGLNARNRIMGETMAARGGAHALAVKAADILRLVLAMGASAFVLVHNHPGGDPTPSREDVTFTHATLAAANVIGLSMVDHVVTASGGHVSMLESGLMEGS